MSLSETKTKTQNDLNSMLNDTILITSYLQYGFQDYRDNVLSGVKDKIYTQVLSAMADIMYIGYKSATESDNPLLTENVISDNDRNILDIKKNLRTCIRNTLSSRNVISVTRPSSVLPENRIDNMNNNDHKNNSLNLKKKKRKLIFDNKIVLTDYQKKNTKKFNKN
jgi:hypothetical protein